MAEGQGGDYEKICMDYMNERTLSNHSYTNRVRIKYPASQPDYPSRVKILGASFKT